MTEWLIDLCGYLGAALVLIAYILASKGKLMAKSRAFQLMNAAGAGLLVVYLLSLGAYPNVFLNAIWFVIAIVTLFRLR